jgi:hypothetical protein
MSVTTRRDLQRPSHVGNALQGGDVFKSFIPKHNLATLHQLVKAKVNILLGCCEFAVVDVTGRVVTTRVTELRDLAGGRKEEGKQWGR